MDPKKIEMLRMLMDEQRAKNAPSVKMKGLDLRESRVLPEMNFKDAAMQGKKASPTPELPPEEMKFEGMDLTGVSPNEEIPEFGMDMREEMSPEDQAKLKAILKMKTLFDK